MLDCREVNYAHRPEYLNLPKSIREGLGLLWEKTTGTGTEWVGSVIQSRDKYILLPLGHQARNSVDVPIFHLDDIISAPQTDLQAEIDEKTIRLGLAEKEWQTRHIPNRDGTFYQGSILYLLPTGIGSGQRNLLRSILPPEDILIPAESLTAIVHSHLDDNEFSYLPSRKDAHGVASQLLSIFEYIVSGEYLSLLIKFCDTPHTEDYTNKKTYQKQEFSGNGISLDTLEETCRQSKLGLYTGKLDSLEPLRLLF